MNWLMFLLYQLKGIFAQVLLFSKIQFVHLQAPTIIGPLFWFELRILLITIIIINLRYAYASTKRAWRKNSRTFGAPPFSSGPAIILDPATPLVEASLYASSFHEIRTGKQRCIHGPAVNVPSKLDSLCNLLPRLPSQTELVPLKLKRKLRFKGHYMYDNGVSG